MFFSGYKVNKTLEVKIYKITLPRVKKTVYITEKQYQKIKGLVKLLVDLAKDNRDLVNTYRLYEKLKWDKAKNEVLKRIKRNLEDEIVIENLILSIIKVLQSDRKENI